MKDTSLDHRLGRERIHFLLLNILLVWSFFDITCLIPSHALAGCIKGDCEEGYGEYVYQNSKYMGEFHNGRRHGKGKRIYNDGSWYEGEWKRGRMDGKGVYVDAQGNRYEGTWHKGRRDGKGVLITSDGRRLEVEYKNGELITPLAYEKGGASTSETPVGSPSHVSKVFSDGSTYLGEINDRGQFHGKGVRTFRDGTSFNGEWVNGRPEGEGLIKYSDGAQYKGSWHGGYKAGMGSYKSRNLLYDGGFDESLPNGTGTLKIKGLGTYKGQFANGAFNGMGEMHYENGDIYKGFWKDGRKHGPGTYYFSNGDRFEGEWVKGIPKGKGTLTTKAGFEVAGDWDGDKLLG
ncbi:MAG TPA: hypothetical protein ENJ63_00570, partial [Dissulfuribacter thermophilus]|nr:hypothetical protein [Dissulfuribacter thermophilus]